MKVGYARVSTTDQLAGYESQIEKLKSAGCEKIFHEKLSGKDRKRPELAAALDFLREGDSLIVCKMDRLARSTADFLQVVQDVQAKGAGFVVLDMGGQPCDMQSPSGKLTLTIMAAVAEFERGIMLERQREGIARAKSAGVYAKNSRPGTSESKKRAVIEAYSAGDSHKKIADSVGVSLATVYRILKAVKNI